jgi:hypothetical protein
MTAVAGTGGRAWSVEPQAPLGRVEVHPGAGVVLRRRHVLLVVPVVEEPHRDVVAEMLRIGVQDGGQAGADAPRQLREVLGRACRDRTCRVPDLACLVRDGDNLLVLTYGAVPVALDGRQQNVSPGGPSAEWLQRTVPATFTSLSVGDVSAALDDEAGSLRLDLLEGTVPGGGATLHLSDGVDAERVEASPLALQPSSGTGSEATAGSLTVVRRTPRTGVVSLAPRPADPARRRRPLPVGAAPRGGQGPREQVPDTPTKAARSPVLVSGIVCRCGELNSPDARECGTCGGPLDPEGPREVRARPPLGVLIVDDGRVFTLTDDVVLGREPTHAAEVRTGHARPLVLRDSDQSTSRVHAELRLSDWHVEVADRGSANGTFLSRSGAAGPWLPVPQGPGLTLAPGDRLRLGRRELLFDRYQPIGDRS